MKQLLIVFLSLYFISCSSDDDEFAKKISIKLNFTQNWDGTSISKEDFSKFDFENQRGTKLSIEKLRYLISKINLIKSNNDTIKFKGYALIDLNNNSSMIHELPQQVVEGMYDLSFTFGFNEKDNLSGIYPDLNALSWNVPSTLGGGYHFMQLDGKYKDDLGIEESYNFHVIRAYDMETQETKDTSFTINLGNVFVKNNATIEVKMNVAEWFKNPHQWNLNERSIMLMGNFDAQKDMSDNGRNVFSLGEIFQ